MPELVVSKQGRTVFRVPFTGARFAIGRSPQNDLVLPDESVSRDHAVITCEDKAWFVENRGKGGTVLGKKPVQKAKLSSGQKIRIGDWGLLFVLKSRQDREFDREVETCITRISDRPDTRILKFDPKKDKFIVSKPCLVITQKGGEARRVDLPSSKVVLGSNASCDIVIDDEYVSGRHCRIVPDGGGFFLEDLNSTNGTWVGEVRINRAALKRPIEFVIGKTRVRFDDAGADEAVLPMDQNHFCGLVGQTESMRLLFSRIARVAPTDQTVLVYGETGSGKELVARAIHELSPRRDKPYVILNCGAISVHLIESELFGHEKGAFTGAVARRAGAFEQANNGTLFLDEIGELPLELQPKLLRVLENRAIRRVGGDEEIPVDVRIVAATHKNLSEQVKKGTFREDLFFRLFVIPLSVPPLKDRKDDVPLLADYFLRQASPQSPLSLSPEVLSKLAAYSWPGNVRELKNVVLRSLVFCDGPVIRPEHIELIGGDPGREAERMSLDRVEKYKILEALEKTGGNKAQTADLLGIAKSTLFKKLKDYGIGE
ncbi:MAG: sigma 54-interacting transcriptional regulator [Deltaproteobacteria bacterium]|nr:sigma 54-interacting transcriptional regulator [Deltaproteobacteria bacterium]